MELHETQQEAVDRALDSSFAIVNGGAGTGKTTIIKEMATGATLCAFTGKAAARLKEATKHPASTIHRMLGFRGTMFMVKTLKGRTIIVDEASMLDSDMMAQIMSREPRRLILVGDEAQLPPVQQGQPFHDLIKAFPDKVVNLTKCFRNKEAVFKAATEIRNGRMPKMIDDSGEEQWEVRETGGPEQTQNEILDMIRNGQIDFDTDIILCPRNGSKDNPGACTVKALNAAIVQIVNPRESDERLKVGDRVINTKNYPDLDIWNGTTGTIAAIDYDNSVYIKLDIPIVDSKHAAVNGGETIYTNSVKVLKKDAKTLELAYALTVHKAQGSQYKNVIFCCLTRDITPMLTRSLIYTAITRTQTSCLVMGQRKALATGICRISEKQTVIQKLAKEQR